MKVSGFTFIKNAIIYDYPVVEAIQSILPICDEVVVAVGKSEDNTRDLIAGIHPTKIKIVDTVWDESLREGGRVLAVETDKALAAISPDSDWAFYIQGDEVIHERYLPLVKTAMETYLNDARVDGLLFNYLHFYGSYDYVGASPNWYPHEIRVIKNDPAIGSFRDAQGFRKKPDAPLKVIPIDAYMYHYGWVKAPEAMQKKQENFNKYWHDDEWVDQNVEKVEAFDYAKHIRELKRFEGSHPRVIQPRIATKNWEFEHDISINNLTFKDKIKAFFKRTLGWDFGYKNYVKVKPKR